ncbi:MAG: histidine kinase [Siphonobacter sp.]
MLSFDTWNTAFVGMVTAMLLFNVMQWYLHQERVYGYYTLYMLCWVAYFVLRNEIILPRNVDNFVRIAVPMMSYYIYFDFTSTFIGLQNGLLLRVFRYTQSLLLIYIGLELLLCFFTNEWQQPFHEALHITIRTILILVSGYVITKLFSEKTPLIRYFITGSALLVFFGMVAMVTTMIGLPASTPLKIWEAPLFYMQVGIMLELLCFSLGLGYRHRLASIEKAVAEEQLFREREQRERERLEMQLDTQEANRLMSNLRMRALRAQMNPHFLFNALNAIQECILTQQTDVAARYLAKFSKLVRLILDNSEKSTIPLSAEVESLKLYLDVESLRFTQAFWYEIEVNTHIDPALISIPPMLVQPYVENAIWHGLLHKEGERLLKIVFRSDDDYLYITVEDNGIGRNHANQIRNPLKQEHTSKGMKLTDERLQAYSEREGDIASAEIDDLFAPDGTSRGTRVRLILPC